MSAGVVRATGDLLRKACSTIFRAFSKPIKEDQIDVCLVRNVSATPRRKADSSAVAATFEHSAVTWSCLRPLSSRMNEEPLLENCIVWASLR